MQHVWLNIFQQDSTVLNNLFTLTPQNNTKGELHISFY